MGQEVSVTPIQIASAISAIANGGTLYPPRIIRQIQGDASPVERADSMPWQVTDEKTAAEMRGMMEDVVLEGTGKPAQLNGYTAGGKSGTAQKIDPGTGRYSATQYNSSFLGFAPVNEPAVTILVVLDSPVGTHHGGAVGGPVFKKIAEQVLAYLAVPHDVPAPSDVETAKNTRNTPPLETKKDADADASEARFKAALPKPAVKGDADPAPPTVAFSGQDGIAVPNLVGRSVRAVMEECARVGLAPSLIDSGVALEQFPGAGSVVPAGSRVTVRFGRPGVLLPASVRGAEN
jgi:cell division protein FtsI (penicillin-binding protein 3)